MAGRRASLVAFYLRKPPALAQLIGDVQRMLAARFGEAFRPYSLDQAHATIISLEGSPAEVEAFLAHVRQLWTSPPRIQLGGYAPNDRRFLSRNEPPYQRSFSIQTVSDRQTSIVSILPVLIGWPIGSEALQQCRLDALSFNIVHKYFAGGERYDNDLYMRLGLFSAPPSETEGSRAEAEIRQLLSESAPAVIDIGLCDLGRADFEDETLPPASTRFEPLTPQIG